MNEAAIIVFEDEPDLRGLIQEVLELDYCLLSFSNVDAKWLSIYRSTGCRNTGPRRVPNM